MAAYLTLGQMLERIQKAISWAGKCKAPFVEDSDLGLIREANQPWIEVELSTLEQLSDEAVSEDIEDPEEPSVENPRKEYVVTQKLLTLRLRGRSRNQDITSFGFRSGFTVLSDVQSRIRFPVVDSLFFDSDQLALAEVGDVVNSPTALIMDDRRESQATLMLSFNVALVDDDTASVGTYIESADITTDFENPAGESLPDELQWEQEVIESP